MERKPNRVDHWIAIEKGLTRLCQAWASGQLLPILEADFAGYLYYVLVSERVGDAKFLHLETRLARSKSNAKFDFVIGEVLTTEDQKNKVLTRAADLPTDLSRLVVSKASLALFRPGAVPEIILEFKAFPVGFTPQQHRVHFFEALDDLEKLKGVGEVCPDGRAIVLFDGDSYLREKRLNTLLEKRAAEDERIRVYVCHRDVKRKIAWGMH